MAQVLIRDLDEKVLKTLKQRAEQNKRSLQRELHVILARAATAGEATHAPQRAGTPARRRKVAPRGSVWNWLKRRSTGGLSKQDIDSYIRAERDSWDAA
jgi:plasmid stability protein